MKTVDARSPVKVRLLILAVCIVALAFLYFWNPSDIRHFPRCPFVALTGLKCPGCGTLRGIHALLHFRFREAFRLNPFMLFSLPVIAWMLLSPKFRFNVTVGRTILFIVLTWWIVRNIPFFGF